MWALPAFKISAPLIKPTRESLLDYCSYCLIIVSLIGLARVWIGGAGLRRTCEYANYNFELSGEDVPHYQKALSTQVTVFPSRLNASFAVTIKNLEQSDFYISGEHKNFGKERKEAKEGKETLLTDGEDVDNLRNNESTSNLRHACAIRDQTMFAYIIFIQSSTLLFAGLIWPKVPRVSHALDKFTKIIHACEKSDWAKKALNIITDKKQVDDVSQSLYSIISSECTVYNIKSLLDTLFHPDSEYRTKASARHLYERVQMFCETNSQTNTVVTTYIVKSVLQFILWITIFNINLVLFVVLEFYVMCSEDSPKPCDHDTFLRIIWFFAETLLVIYAFFNCKTLLWISEKSAVRSGSCCNSINCFRRYRTAYADEDPPRLVYRFADNPPVYNDVALLLHLLEEAHPEIVPYFVVFMFPEWKEKLTSFSKPVTLLGVPARTSVQIANQLSGRPPPVIEITDIHPHGEASEQHDKSVLRRKRKATVTFYIGSETGCNSNLEKDPLKLEDSSVNSPFLSPPTICHSKPVKVKFHSSVCNTHPKKESCQSNDLVNYSATLSDYDNGAVSGDNDETMVLVHRTSSSDSIRSSDQDSPETMESNQSDASETHLLLGST